MIVPDFFEKAAMELILRRSWAISTIRGLSCLGENRNQIQKRGFMRNSDEDAYLKLCM